jgi:UDP-glucose 4-epimerase
MPNEKERELLLVTGANGQIGQAVCLLLRAQGLPLLATDIASADSMVREAGFRDFLRCDLTSQENVQHLFEFNPIRAVVHLAAVLPTAALANPLAATAVNVCGSLHLLEQSVRTGVRRFVFASSMSVFGSAGGSELVSEDDVPVPDDPYGAAKRTVEIVGERLSKLAGLEFVSLRIARVIGGKTRNTASPWRSQIVEDVRNAPDARPVAIPFSPDARLSLVHTDEVARMLVLLATTPHLPHTLYHCPAELWTAVALKDAVEKATSRRIELATGNAQDPGVTTDGSRFVDDFHFQLRGVAPFLKAHCIAGP